MSTPPDPPDPPDLAATPPTPSLSPSPSSPPPSSPTPSLASDSSSSSDSSPPLSPASDASPPPSKAPEDPRTILRRHGLYAKKSWGQNFLVEERTYREIVRAAAATEEDWVIEIGAGLGTLTARLAKAAGHVVAVERDRDMAEVLRAELGAEPRVEIAEANALTFDYGAVARRAGRRPIVVGNLPYQIASPILFRLFDARADLVRVVVMLQKEMADRIVAAPGTPEYGGLGVMVRMFGEPKIVCRVAPGAFHPPPRVASAVVRIELFSGTRVPVADVEAFRAVVRAAFGQRRKTLRNALKALAGAAALDRAFAEAGVDEKVRGETLDVAAFATLTDALVRAGARLPSGGARGDDSDGA